MRAPLTSSNKQRHALVIALALVLLAPAFLRCHRWLDGVSWPRDPDYLRNNGQAQAMLDGDWAHDPILAGETAWYPPLMAALIAGAHRITGLPLIEISAQGGLWFNLAAVIMLFAAAWRLMGGWGALLCLSGFLYLLGAGLNSYAEVGLSPLIEPISFVLGPWCLALVAMRGVLAEKAGLKAWLGAGLASGICFIGHPSSAMILVLTCVMLAASLIAKGSGPARTVSGLVAFAAAFLVLSSVVLAPLWSAYGLQARNSGFAWIYGPIALVKVHRTLLGIHPVVLAIALLGIASAIKRRGAVHQLLLSAFASACILYLWSSVSSEYFLMKRELPIPKLVVPPHHFYFFLKALLCFFFAQGALTIGIMLKDRIRPARWAQWSTGRLSNMLEWRAGKGRVLILGTLVLCLLAVGLRWAMSPDITFNGIARGAKEPGLLNPYRHILSTTSPGDVFLCDDELAFRLIAPAGRKVVATHPLFASPYVDILPRIADRDSMLSALHRGDASSFHELAERHGVTRIALAAVDEQAPHAAFGMRPEYTNDTVAVYRWPVPSR